MNPVSLKAKGVVTSFSEPGILKGWKLSFSVPDFFKIEGGTGNIEPDKEAEVHGVIYYCQDDDLKKLDELEALGGVRTDVPPVYRSLDL